MTAKPETLGTQFPDDYYIVDVGMNDGKDSDYYAKRGFKVIAFEANPTLTREADQKFQTSRAPVEVRNRAISDEDGTLTFYVNRFNHAWSSLDPFLGERREGAEQIDVSSCNLTEELADVCDRIHYVKIDIEGYDLVALKQVLKLPALPKYLSVENGGRVMLKELHEAGYTRFKFSNQMYVPGQSVPANSQHGHVIEHTFLRSSSGMFGEDLLGGWFDYDQIVAVNEGLEYGRSKAPNNLWALSVGWFDLHAALPE